LQEEIFINREMNHGISFLFIYDYKINSNSSLCELCGKIASFLF